MNTNQYSDQKLLARRTYHFKLRQRERCISCQAVLMTLRFGLRHEHSNFVYFYLRGLLIVADRYGNLVTAYYPPE